MAEAQGDMSRPNSGEQAVPEQKPFQDIASAFAVKLREKNIPPTAITEEDAIGFANFILEKYPPEGFLDRLVSALQFVDRESFEADVHLLSEKVQEQLKGSPFAAFFTGHSKKSGYWMYNNLVASGLPQATQQFSETFDETVPEGVIPIHTRQDMDSQLHPGISVVIPDDQTMSGAQVTGLLNEFTVKEHPTVVALVYASEVAEELLQRYPTVTPVILHKLKPCGQSLTIEDLAFLKELTIQMPNLTQDEENVADHVPLFFTWYKVPDNVFEVLRAGPHPLIREENFRPPYKE